MSNGPRSTEEMARFPLALSWPFEKSTSEGEIKAEDGNLWLDSAIDWPIRQIAGTAAIASIDLRGVSDRGPFYLLGMPIVMNGICRLRIDDLRIGSDDPDEPLMSATPFYDYASEVVRYYQRDGAARFLNEPLDLRALDGAPAISLLYAPRTDGSPIEIRTQALTATPAGP